MRFPHHEPRPAPAPSPSPTARAGVDVLVGFDGSPESMAAARTAVEVLGERARRVTLCAVVPFDVPEVVERRAGRELHEAAQQLGPSVGESLTHGTPAPALLGEATAGGYDLVVVGRRGRERSAHVLGSTAIALASWNGSVPALLVG